jgi:molecular chaperone GrpE
VSEEFDNEQVVEEATQIVEEAEAAELVEEDLDELGLLAKERDELRAVAQRIQADFENYKKRAIRQAEESATRQAGDVVASLLPVLDTLELAKGHATADSPDASALVQVQAQLLDILTKLGLEAVPGVGEPFDPQFHDAVAHAEGDEATDGPVVDEVLRAGFAWRGTVLRPAMVRVKG